MAISDSYVPNLTDGSGNPAPVPFQNVLVDGAITIACGTVVITKATAGAITIDNPPAGMNGAVLHIVSTTAAAHVITYTAGFGGGTTARDVATFGGAISDGMIIVAYNSVWWISATRNVTLG